MRRLLPAEAVAGQRAGIEHELVVRAGGEVVDFRAMVADLHQLGARMDPADPNARRGGWGGVITADGREAEIATPPAPLAPGFTGTLGAWAAAGRYELGRALPDCSLEGFSTHISVSVDDRRALGVARRFTSRFGPAMMLMLDRRDSPGLLVRPRRHRLELCGEYVTGRQRQAALVFAAGAVEAAAALPARRLPPRLRLAVEPAVERFGFYVDRRAAGPDLYAGGRGALLRAGRRSITAQAVLEQSWEASRPFALGFASRPEVALVDSVVAGEAPLPLEHPEADVAPGRPGDRRAPVSPYARLVERRERAGVAVEPVAATWDVTVLSVEATGRRRFVSVPSVLVAELFSVIDTGGLDDLLSDLLATPAHALPAVRSASVGDGFGVFGSLAGVAHVVPRERDVRSGRVGRGGGGSSPGGREQKGRDRTPRPRRAGLGGAPLGLSRRVLAAGAVGLIALVLAAVAGAALLGGDDAVDVTAGRSTDADGREAPAGPAVTAGFSFEGAWALEVLGVQTIEAVGEVAGRTVSLTELSGEEALTISDSSGMSAFGFTQTRDLLVCGDTCSWRQTNGLPLVTVRTGEAWRWEDGIRGGTPQLPCGMQPPAGAWEIEILGPDAFRWTAVWGGGSIDAEGGDCATRYLATYDVLATRER